MGKQVEEKFTDFFENWVGQLEEHVLQLLKTSKEKQTNEAELQALVSKLTSHHKEYYTVKWAQAHEDVLAFFCPVWLTPIENAYTWLTGWKPSMAFRLITSMRKSASFKALGVLDSLNDMSDEQVKKIEELRVKVKMEEEKVEREMERQQVSLAGRRMVELARVESRVRNISGGGGMAAASAAGNRVEGLVGLAMKSLLVGLEKVMKAADCVRLKCLKGVLDLLSPMQCVDFLAAISMIQIQIRRWGRKRFAAT